MPVLVGIVAFTATAQVESHQKISATQGSFSGILDDRDRFGRSVASIGDLDGDGTTDIAVGAYLDDDGGPDRGAVWVLFLKPDGTVKAHQKISSTSGFGATLQDGDQFGSSLASIGDLDGDGVDDLAVGAPLDDDGGPDRGAFYIVFLNTDGTAKGQVKISDTHGSFSGLVEDGDRFGSSVTSLGDLDNDGITDVFAGVPGARVGGPEHGAGFVFFLDANSSVKSHKRIASQDGVGDDHHFGASAARLGDLDGDGLDELAVGAPNTGSATGVTWVLFLDPDGTVRRSQPIDGTRGGLSATLSPNDAFGSAVAALDDYDMDGTPDLAVGAPGADGTGALWILFSNPDGTVRQQQKIGNNQGGFNGTLLNGVGFGIAVSKLPDLDGDGVSELATGAYQDGDGGVERGATWVLFLESPALATFTVFGTGCPGSAGVPDLDPTNGNLPVLNATFSVDVTNLPVGQPVLAAYGLSNTQWAGISLPLELAFLRLNGCFVFVSIDVALPLPNVGGSAVWATSIPNESGLLGVSFYQQVLVFDPAGPGATTSNAVCATIARR